MAGDSAWMKSCVPVRFDQGLRMKVCGHFRYDQGLQMRVCVSVRSSLLFQLFLRVTMNRITMRRVKVGLVVMNKGLCFIGWSACVRDEGEEIERDGLQYAVEHYGCGGLVRPNDVVRARGGRVQLRLKESVRSVRIGIFQCCAIGKEGLLTEIDGKDRSIALVLVTLVPFLRHGKILVCLYEHLVKSFHLV